MGEALKKHLAKLDVKPGDLVLFKPPLGAPPSDYRGFVLEVAEQLAIAGLGPVVVVQPGFNWETVKNEQLNEMGLMRLWPPGRSESLDALEDEAQAAVRVAFSFARERATARIEAAAAMAEKAEV